MFGSDCGDIKPAIESEDRRHLYEQALKCIDREENLIHYRMSWGLQWSVGGFAILVVLLSSDLPSNWKGVITSVLSLFGMAVCGIAFFAVMAAHQQSWFVINTLCKGLGIGDHDWSRSEFIRPYGESKVHISARWISKYLFLMIALLWIFVVYFIVVKGAEINFSLPSSR